eukprot:Skav210609  [mRNA]  locus=scaffold234:170544:179860:- [translate_table: standard]
MRNAELYVFVQTFWMDLSSDGDYDNEELESVVSAEGNLATFEHTQEVDNDDVNLMHSVSSTTIFAHIYGLRRTTLHGRIPWNPYESRLQAAADIINCPRVDLVALHRVAVPLHGEPMSARVFISELQDDLQPPRTSCLVIFEVIKDFHTATSVDPQYIRKVGALPRWITRNHILRAVRSWNFCQVNPTGCLVYHNDVRWDDYGGQTSWKTTGHGDVFMVRYQLEEARLPWFADEEPRDGPSCSVDTAYTVSDELEPAERSPVDLESSTDEEQQTENWGTPHQSEEEEHDETGIPALSWYIHHHSWRLCERPRHLLLRYQNSDWANQLAQAWHDLFALDQTAKISIVQPQPDESFGYGPPRPMHVLLEQGFHGDRVGILVQNEPTLVQPHAFPLYALSVPHYATADLIVQLAGLEATCSRRGRCYCTHGARRLAAARPNDVPSGALVFVRVHRSDEANSSVPEEAGLLQFPLSDTLIDAHSAWCSRSLKEPIIFRLGEDNQTEPLQIRHLDRTMPIDAQDQTPPVDPPVDDINEEGLQDLWNHHIIDGVTALDEPGLKLITFFLHGQRIALCLDPRVVLLPADRSQWHQLLQQLWIDQLDANEAFQVHIVNPVPPHRQAEGPINHIILKQAFRHDQRAWHLSISQSPSALDYRAVIGPRVATEYQLMLLADLGPQCYRQVNFYTCLAHRSDTTFTRSTALRTTHGSGFHLQVLDEPRHRRAALSAFELDAQSEPLMDHLSSADNLQAVHDIRSHWHLQTAHSSGIPIRTWFVHHQRHLRCENYRLWLSSHASESWISELETIWGDHLNPHEPYSIRWIQPQPSLDHEHPYTGHLLIVQGHDDGGTRQGVLIAGQLGWQIRHQAFSVLNPATAEMLIWYIGFSDVCGPGRDLHHCEVTTGNTRLYPSVPYSLDPGQCIDILGRLRSDLEEVPLATQDEAAFLQMHVARSGVTERLKVEQVAHTQLPDTGPAPIPISLWDHLGYDDRLEATIIDMTVQPPAFIYVSSRVNESMLYVDALNLYIVPHASFGTSDLRYYILVTTQEPTQQPTLYGLPSWWPRSELEILKFLYRQGHWRAVIMKSQEVQPHLHVIHFVNNKPQLEDQTASTRQAAERAEPQPTWPYQVCYPPGNFQHVSGPQLLTHGLDEGALDRFFDGCNAGLCSTLEGIQLPPATVAAYEALVEAPALEDLDRLIIYTDGSSQPHQRGLPVLQVAQEGRPDTWACVVLGEQYATASRPARLSLLGWMAHPVIYEENHDYYAHATRLGSDIAEREAVIWASLWRLRLNCNLPTLFRSDSDVTARQALGTMGTGEASESYRLLRAVSQTLRALLPGDMLRYEHVYGHCGKAWNELADTLATQEGEKSFFLARPGHNLAALRDFMPYLWMVFAANFGMPPLSPQGFNVPPVQVPQTEDICLQQRSTHIDVVTVQCSFISANVNSLSCGPEGHAGKLDYLREQFIHSRGNFMGLQEARSAKGSSSACQVLRLCSGAHGGNGGIELWINLQQPIGYSREDNTPIFLKNGDATSQTRLHDGVLPVRQAQGPHIPAALGQDFDHHDDLFEQMIVDALFDLNNVAEIGPTVRGLVTDKPISWTLFRATVVHLCDQLGQAEADHMGLPYENLTGELRALCDPASWDFLSRSPGPGRTTTPLTLHDYELHFQALARDAKLCQYFSVAARVPRPVGRERYVLHAFSGRRRPGDIEWFIDGIRAECPQEILLFVISVDIIIHSELGDVSRAQTKELWYRGVRERWIVGFLAGPPCETWSQARKNALEPEVDGRPRRGPRVIRASDAPWGMTQLRVKEIAQLFTSNVLMTFTIELAVLTILFGGCGMVEHPAPPEDEQAPSIWRQPIMHLLCQLPCSSWIHLDQGRLGAASKKPTSLLAIRMPTLAARVQEWALTNKSPSTVSIGLDSQGRFLTAPLKEYPPAFCMAIAQGLCDTLLQLPAHPDCTVPASFKEVCVRMRAGFGQHIGPDFAKP